MSQLSPFKFLDSYDREDREVFFGRNEEIENLYNALSGVKHLLVYGPSGAGKTSLIECGLRNQFSDADWFAITIRRGVNINKSFFTLVNDALQDKIALDPETNLPIDININFGQAIEALFAERYQPVYLLFDQFEELLILGEEAEKKSFFERLNQLIRYRVPCRVLLIMREEFIGHLSEFEEQCPTIFQHRLRLEKMRRSKMPEVIYEILNAAQYKSFFEVKDSEELTKQIFSKLPDIRNEIELAHLQVFLDELWDRANNKENNTKPILEPALIEEKDNLQSVLDIFLKKQLNALDKQYGESVALELLATMISDRDTKLQRTKEDIQNELQNRQIAIIGFVSDLLTDLQRRRIIRPLRAGGAIQYEISHDILASLVGQNRTEEMTLRERAQDAYIIYKEREGYFSSDDLNFLRPFEKYLPYPPTLQKRIEESEKHLKDEQQREVSKIRKRLILVGSVSVVAIMAFIIAVIFFVKARDQTIIAQKQSEKADTALREFIKEKASKERLDFNDLNRRANIVISYNACPDSILIQMEALALHHPDSINMHKQMDDIRKGGNCK
jgi:hypothetical protein